MQELTKDDILLSFEGKRNIVELTKGSTTNKRIYDVYAIPITEEEVKDIKVHARKHKMYKLIPLANMVSIGDPNEPTKKDIDYIPYIHTRGLDGKPCKSYFYPPSNKFPTTRDHVIPFEDGRVAWNYHAKLLLLDVRFKNIVIIKIKK